ncbi:hypothetical protein JZU71_00400, partial [bacterium]|nr:hypothetical protein [bacterium]
MNILLEEQYREIRRQSLLLTEAFNEMGKRVEERTAELEKERIKSLQSLLIGQESERERIAQDLHDALSIRLIGLKRMIEPAVNQYIPEILPEIDAIIFQVRE